MSLVVQWSRTCLPMPETRIRKIPRYWAIKLVCHNYWALVPQASTLQREATTKRKLHTAAKRSLCLHQLEKVCAQQGRPSAAKKKEKRNYNEIPPHTCQDGYCRGGKHLFPLPFQTPDWDPCKKKRQINTRKLYHFIVSFMWHEKFHKEMKT